MPNRRFFLAAFVILLLADSFTPPAFAQSKPFTLEQIMSAPFTNNLVAAEKSNRVAWVFNIKGVRNVWVADGADFAKTARQVTHYDSDNGIPIASLRLTPDGSSILYALGSETNDDKEGKASANPQHTTTGVKQQVFAMDLNGKGASEPRLLGEMGCGDEDCEDIEISPDGKQAVWAAKGKLWIATIHPAAGVKASAMQLTWVRGEAQQPKWSADGKHIAFVSDRGDHSFIVVYDLGSTVIRYLSPSVDKDFMPRWSPDGKQIAFVRARGTEQKLPIIPERPEPWSLWVGDAATGQARKVWASGNELKDSMPENMEDGSLRFAADNRIVFCSEQDGRNHLYSVAASGGAPTLLTPGDFDTEDVTLSADKKTVIYASNENDVDRRHIWRVPVAGGPQQAVTSGETIEWSPVQTGGGKAIVSLGSSATSTAMPYVIGEQGREMLAKQVIPNEFPSDLLLTPKQVIFKSEDGLTLHGQLFLPRETGTARLPGLVFMHGGPMRQMMLGFHYMDYYHNAYAMNQYLASRGYVVLSVNYRLGIMYGQTFRKPPHSVWRGAAEYQDVVAAGKYLQTLPQVDAGKIGLWGGSYGGFLTAMGLARNSDLFKSGVDFHGVHDWSVFLPQWENSSRKAPDIDAANKLAFESSPDSSVASWRSPVLLIHGDDDRNVPFEQTVDLVQRLREQKVPFGQMILPDEIHGFLMWKSWVQAYGGSAEFFDRTLKRGEKISAGN